MSDSAKSEMMRLLSKCAELSAESAKFKEDVRRAVANYIKSEGCECCRGSNHAEHQNVLAELLDVPRYDDDSGNNFGLFEKKNENMP